MDTDRMRLTQAIRDKSLGACVVLMTVGMTGCAETFLGAGGFFSTFGSGLNSIGTCLSPLTPIALNEVFSKAPAAVWA